MSEKWKVRYGRAVNDPEKAILPAFVWCMTKGKGITIRSVAIGWWDFHFSVALIRLATPTSETAA